MECDTRSYRFSRSDRLSIISRYDPVQSAAEEYNLGRPRNKFSSEAEWTGFHFTWDLQILNLLSITIRLPRLHKISHIAANHPK